VPFEFFLPNPHHRKKKKKVFIFFDAMAQATCQLDRNKIIAVRSVRLTLIKCAFNDGSFFHCIGFSVMGQPREVFKVSEYMMPRLMG